MTNINISNLEKIIFSDQKVQEYLRCELPELYGEWQNILFTNNHSQKMKFNIKFLSYFFKDKVLNDIEKIINTKINVDYIDVNLVKHYDISIENLASLNFLEIQDYKFFSLYRKDKNIYVTTWR